MNASTFWPVTLSTSAIASAHIAPSEVVAHRADDVAAAGVGERLLDRRQRLVQEDGDEVVLDVGAGDGRAAADVLLRQRDDPRAIACRAEPV